MKAVRIHAYGGTEQLVVDDIPVPVPAAGEVLVRIKAAGVNPVDWKIREGYLQAMLKHPLPLTLGWDAAGVVEALGAGVTTFAAGDAVYTRPAIDRNGTYAEYAVVRAEELARKPANVSFEAAAGVPLAALTAWLALADEGKLQRGHRVLIHAGAGGVGSFAIQLARHWGAEVIATASTRNVDLVRSLGADRVIDYTREDFAELRDVDLVLDTIGGDTQRRSLDVLKSRGHLISIVGINPETATAAAERGVTAKLAWIVPNGPRLAELAKLIEDGVVRPLLGQVFPLADAQAAHQLSETGRAVGKIVLKVAD